MRSHLPQLLLASLVFLATLPYSSAEESPESDSGKITIVPGPRDAIWQSDAKAEVELWRRMTEESYDWDLPEVSLCDLAELVAQRMKCEVRLDDRGLGDVGLLVEAPVALRLQGVSTATALGLALYQRELTFITQADRIVITNPMKVESVGEQTRFYAVDDLLTAEGRELDGDLFLGILFDAIGWESWEPNVLKELEMTLGGLAIKQSTAVHRKLEQLVAVLRTAKKLPADNYKVRPITLEPIAGRWDEAIDRLRQTTVSFAPSAKPTLEQLAEQLQKETGLNVVLDIRAFEEIDWPRERVLDEITNTPTSVLQLLNDLGDDLQFSWYILDNVLRITTAEGLVPSTRVYPVRDLLHLEHAMTHPLGDMAPKYEQYLDPLLIVAITMVEPSSWEFEGGPGTAVLVPAADCLVIRQTDRSHLQIEKFLTEIRTTRAESLARRQAVLRELGEKTVTQIYLADGISPQDLPQLATDIRRSIEPESWDDEHSISIYSDRLVIHHRWKIHWRIEALLDKHREAAAFKGIPAGNRPMVVPLNTLNDRTIPEH